MNGGGVDVGEGVKLAFVGIERYWGRRGEKVNTSFEGRSGGR